MNNYPLSTLEAEGGLWPGGSAESARRGVLTGSLGCGNIYVTKMYCRRDPRHYMVNV